MASEYLRAGSVREQGVSLPTGKVVNSISGETGWGGHGWNHQGWWTHLAGGSVLPSQLRDRARVNTPETELQFAVFQEALSDLRPPVGKQADRLRKRQAERQDAIDWFESTDTDHPFAFERICMTFDWEPDAWRRQLRAMGWMLDGIGYAAPDDTPRRVAIRRDRGHARNGVVVADEVGRKRDERKYRMYGGSAA